MIEILQQVVNGIILGSVYALIAVGLSLIFGVCRIIQWAHGEVYMLGAYMGYMLFITLGIPYFISLILTIILTAILGMLIERFIFRPLKKFPSIMTNLGAIGLSFFLLNFAILFISSEPWGFPVPQLERVIAIGPIDLTLQRIIVFVVALVLILGLSLFIKKTVTGRAMLAMAQDPEAASLMGIDVNRTSALSFAIGSGLAGAAGIIIAPIFLLYPQMSQIAVAKGFPIVVLGGLGSVEGAIVGAYILGLVESLMVGFISSTYKDVVGFVILILILYFKPDGLFGQKIMEKV